MSKGLEAFEDIKTVMKKLFGGVEHCEKALDTIEKEIKALEIIKRKNVHIYTFMYYAKDNTYEEFNMLLDYMFDLTQEEYELLKEVLK